MKKTLKKTIIFSIFGLIAVLVTAILLKPTKSEEIEEIPLTDLAATYEGKATDENGNLLAPFDVVYPDAFNSGEFEYDENYILLKFASSFNGELNDRLKKCGVVSLSKFMGGNDGIWYRAEVSNDTDAKTAVMKARSLSEILVADFDYIYEETAKRHPVGPSHDCRDHLHHKVHGNKRVGEQWYLTACDIQSAWEYLEEKGYDAGGSSSVIVAVIDTGVDYNHEDLKANMWVNTAEISGNGIDDDKNGYIDDIHGIDVIANNGNPMDDHGHGTHVAGIIAASNNNIGIAGIAYNSKIMAVKAGQATGVFLQSDIAEAILYAYQMGADVINMSFGGSACSLAVQDALTQAYTTSTLVASAGNDGKPNQSADFYNQHGDYLPNYPGALSYVIGVMSVDYQMIESSFTNWDVSEFNSAEFEIYAPGEAMLSTLPNNSYGKLNGTSMAAPVISGIAALLRSYFIDRDMYPSKFISAQLCSTSGDSAVCCNPKKHKIDGVTHNLPMIVNAYDALTKLPQPNVAVVDFYLFDDESISTKNSGDGVVDAGETINIAPILRNRWGASKDTIITIDADTQVGSNPYIEFITSSVNFGGVGTYSTKDKLSRNGSVIVGYEDPLVIKIAEDCPNDYVVNLNVTLTYKNALNENDKTTYTKRQEAAISFVVRNGVILPSQITADITLTKDNYYIMPNSTYIPEGVCVTVEEGTKIQFWSDDSEDPYADTYIAYLVVDGKFITRGTIDEPVELFPSDMMSDYIVEIKKGETGFVDLEYTNIVNPIIETDYASHCTFTQNCEYARRRLNSGDNMDAYCCVSGRVIKESVFYKVSFDSSLIGIFDTCTFVDSYIRTTSWLSRFNNCLFMGNSYVNEKEEYKNSELTFESNSLTTIKISSVMVNEDTNKPYILIQSMISGKEIIEDFAEYLGGHLVYIETKEELEFIRRSFNSSFVIGMNSKLTHWNNGEVLNLDIDTKISSYASDTMPHVIYDVSNNCIENAIHPFSYQNGYFLIEIEDLDEALKTIDDKDSFVWNVENFNKLIEPWKNANVSFYKNAIINNLNLTDRNKWFNICTEVPLFPEDYTGPIGLSKNYWQTLDIDMVNKQIIDFDDYKDLPDLVAEGFLTEAPCDTFPFVTNVTILNSNGEEVTVVSNETIKVRIEFNRDMDITVPLRVRFGSIKPYADYEITGNYIDARTWEGTYTLNTMIENGNQYFNISNGRAASNHYLRLFEMFDRFTFEIDTFAAQALVMQAAVTEEGVNLTWTQDDFDTLAGYNIYRSTSEDGLYTKLNSHVIPYDSKEFFDNTVEPGKLYYYNFTVVKTDLTESTPSGKVSIRSLDTMAPNIYHSPVYTGYTGSNLLISATITDNLQISEAKLYYRTVGSTEWQSIKMYSLNSRYTGIIYADHLDIAGLEYYIEAFDGISYTYKGSSDNPYLVTIKLAVDKSSMGDVDGDGTITAKDALMLLQAANDKLNLTEEQFMRADLNSDGVLSAAEALRILQYVSGKITSVLE